MVPFKYVEFYDVPRIIMFRYKDHLIVMSSHFDSEKDDYDEHYVIELVPSWAEQRIAESSWKVLEEENGARMLGEIPVKDVVFDASLRKTLDPSFLDGYLQSALSRSLA